MKLFLYYAFCSVKNQLRKLLHTWVAVFLLICILFGVVIGLGAGMLAEHFFPDEEPPLEETLPPDGEGTADGEEAVDPDAPLSPEEQAQMAAVLELVFSGIILAMLFFQVVSADKSGSSIFQMADVNLLFASPLKPQSVLLFRLMSQIFVTLFASVYLLCQLPTLVIDLGLDAGAVISLILAWILTLIYAKLLNVLVYTVASTHVQLKKYIRPLLYGLLVVIGGGFYLYYLTHAELGALGAADVFFNGEGTRWIPLYGWLKGLVLWAIEQNWLYGALSLSLLVAGIVVLAVLVWRIKADFYEDAMAKSQETADRLAAAQAGNKAKRKKDRTDRIRRDGLTFGSGANMFFCKSIYNRFRFATLHIFTKTTITYLVISVGLSLLLVLVAKLPLFPIVGLVLCGMVFYRSLGNPLASDMDKSYFVTVPANPYAKVLWSVLGGTVDCALDVLPGVVISALILRADPWEALAYFLLAVGMDFYASNTMLFMELSLPTSLSLQIKQIVVIMFIYFGIIPIAAIVLVGALLGLYLPFLFIAALAAACIGGIFYAFSPMFLLYGRK